jgi:hypothetical protein
VRILQGLMGKLSLRQEVHDLLMRIATSTDREAIKAALRAAGTPLYSADPEHPGMIVQVLPDGTRTLGHMEGRRFVPLESKSIKSPR